LSKHWHVDGQPIENLSASLGLVMFRSGEQLEISELLENADTAMYDAKKHGRNCYSVFRQRAED
jgi:diguanylate cyclase (GGDEF)-like protein